MRYYRKIKLLRQGLNQSGIIFVATNMLRCLVNVRFLQQAQPSKQPVTAGEVETLPPCKDKVNDLNEAQYR